MLELTHQTFDQERALYGSNGISLKYCTFSGPADGESALKESKNITAENCTFALRYPFWHDSQVTLHTCRLEPTCRAAFWYSKNLRLAQCDLFGVKAFRECQQASFDGCTIDSAEFGWNCRHLSFCDTTLNGEYFLLNSSDLWADSLRFTGKYSFQYCKNVEIRNSVLHTKDAFWHAENVTVYDSEISGEYLAWYSKNLRLVRCKISGTQPFCYATDLILEDCTMTGCDLSFEKTSVHATILGSIDSVKNPRSGSITAHSIGEILLDSPTDCIIKVHQ